MENAHAIKACTPTISQSVRRHGSGAAGKELRTAESSLHGAYSPFSAF
jgi:hypothetical protein